ncbi:phage regulatory CII family protein [Stenotrophomonas sp.]|uniref:phage regulatory CII family protein n=1 Tax=Stenotrophomonas sp. TaxID=69392 RepID=UPI0028AD1404|nr:phage regulatory CII family protein [Stenotrophomonas sp.]
MTCSTSPLSWLDTLYNSVRETPGGVEAAALYLAQRRGKSMHTETLRAKLRGLEGESVSLQIAELLTEWMQEQAGGSERALGWLQSLVARFGMAADVVPPAPEGGWSDEIGAMQMKLLEITARVGKLAGATVEAVADGRITNAEAQLIINEIRAMRTMLSRLERNVARAAAKGRAAR